MLQLNHILSSRCLVLSSSTEKITLKNGSIITSSMKNFHDTGVINDVYFDEFDHATRAAVYKIIKLKLDSLVECLYFSSSRNNLENLEMILEEFKDKGNVKLSGLNWFDIVEKDKWKEFQTLHIGSLNPANFINEYQSYYGL